CSAAATSFSSNAASLVLSSKINGINPPFFKRYVLYVTGGRGACSVIPAQPGTTTEEASVLHNESRKYYNRLLCGVIALLSVSFVLPLGIIKLKIFLVD